MNPLIFPPQAANRPYFAARLNQNFQRNLPSAQAQQPLFGGEKAKKGKSAKKVLATFSIAGILGFFGSITGSFVQFAHNDSLYQEPIHQSVSSLGGFDRVLERNWQAQGATVPEDRHVAGTYAQQYFQETLAELNEVSVSSLGGDLLSAKERQYGVYAELMQGNMLELAKQQLLETNKIDALKLMKDTLEASRGELPEDVYRTYESNIERSGAAAQDWQKRWEENNQLADVYPPVFVLSICMAILFGGGWVYKTEQENRYKS